MFFAAREAVRREAREKGRREERARIIKVLTEHGVAVPLDIAYMLAGDGK